MIWAFFVEFFIFRCKATITITIAFAKPVNKKNYPSMILEVTTMDVQGAPEELLMAGYELLS